MLLERGKWGRRHISFCPKGTSVDINKETRLSATTNFATKETMTSTTTVHFLNTRTFTHQLPPNYSGRFSRPYVNYIPWWTGIAMSVICEPDGPKQRKFDIHIKALFNVSPLFANCINKPLESYPAILLPHIPSRVLDSFSTWLYLGTVPTVD